MAACNAIFLLLVVSLFYKDIICDEQQLEALEKKLQMLEQKLLDMENKQLQDENKFTALENKQHTESRKLHRTIETMNQVTNQQHHCEQKLEKQSMKLHQTIAAVDEVKAENQNSLEELGVTKALFLQAMEKVDEVSEKVGQVDSKVDKVDSKVGKLSTPVAFTATMTRGVFRPTSRSSPLPFNSVHLNKGYGYNRYTYKFTCPVSGMYYFSISLYSGNLRDGTAADDSSAYIYHGSDRVTGGRSATWDRDSEMSAQTAASAVIRCYVGEKVEVRPDNTLNNQFYGTSSYPRSFFTGFLITPQ